MGRGIHLIGYLPKLIGRWWAAGVDQITVRLDKDFFPEDVAAIC